MKLKAVSGIMLTLLLTIIMTAPFVGAEIYLYDVVFIEPGVSQVYVGEYLHIDVGFGYGFELGHPHVIEFSLGWDASLLELIYWESFWDSPTVIVGDDYMRVAGDNPGPFGPTTLLWIVFKAKAVGSTILDLYDSNVYASDGYVDILPSPPLPLAIHNIDTGLNYTTIQEAINAPETMGGHTILVDAGIYFEHVIVNKSISLIGESKHNTIIDGSRTGTVIYVSADNVTINGFTVQDSGHLGAESGIYVYNSSFSNISHNIVTYNKYGIRLDWANNNSVTGNTVSNSEHGIHLSYHSSNNIIEGNIAENNHDGIWIFGYAENNVIVGNNVTLNARGINVEASNNRIVGNNVWSNGGDGILLFAQVIESSNNFVAGNNVSKSRRFGIRVYGSNHIIYGNNVSNNNEGIWVYDSNLNNITHNIVSNNAYGICLHYYSMNNILVDNIVSNNGDGIRLIISCNSNTLAGNNVFSNSNGIRFKYSSINNMIFHNNFINNTQQVVSDGSPNTWDDGYPSGGNYWSDYEDRYPNAKELDDSGIWDTPYVIDENNQDNYPLMGPWSPPIERKVGVKVGDWSKYEVAYNYTSNDPSSPFYHPEFAYIEHFKTEVLSVSGTNITFRATTYFENGTEVSKVMWIDISTNVIAFPPFFWGGIPHSPSFFWGAILFTAANLTAGDTLTPNPSSDVINATLMRTYAGAEREVNFVYRRRTSSIIRATPPKEQYIFDSTTYMFWDRATGVLVEANDTTIYYRIELDLNNRPLLGGYVYVTNIFTQMTMKETNIWSAYMHELAVTSSPMTGITFTINGTPQTTPYTESLLEGSYTLEMPETHGEYVWSHWLEDGDTNRIKTVTMNTDISLTAVFTPLDTTPPTISIVSPENKTYTVEDVPLTFTVSESTSWIGYSLDGQANITIAGNTTLTGLSDGMHSLVVYASDITGNMGSSGVVYFTIQTTAIDTTSPSISIVSPENKTYATIDISLTLTVDEIVSLMAYSLDGQANVTITGNTTLSGLSDGSHNLIVYAKDAAGNTGASEMVYFSITTLQPDPFPWWILGAIAGIVVIGIALGTFFLRRRKSVKS